MNASRFIRLLCAVGLLGGLAVVVAAPVGATPLQGHVPQGSWFHHGSKHFLVGRGGPLRQATCTGTLDSPGLLTGTYHSNVVVSGACAIDGGAATILGDLTLSPGSALNATFALNDLPGGSGTSSLTVLGSVNVESGAVLGMGCEPNYSPCSDDPNAGTGGTLTGSDHVFGGLNEFNPLGVIVHASTINGSVNEQGGGGGVNCNVPTTGIFSLLESPVFSDYEDNLIGGNLDIVGLQTCWLGALRNVVRGSVLNLHNTMADPDADEVVSNTVDENMLCFGNSPQVQFGDSNGVSNQVRGLALGECGFGVTQPDPAANEPPNGTPPYYPAGPLTPISIKI
jgi:hypothetical protein